MISTLPHLEFLYIYVRYSTSSDFQKYLTRDPTIDLLIVYVPWTYEFPNYLILRKSDHYKNFQVFTLFDRLVTLSHNHAPISICRIPKEQKSPYPLKANFQKFRFFHPNGKNNSSYYCNNNVFYLKFLFFSLLYTKWRPRPGVW